MPIQGGPQVERGNSGLGSGEGAEGSLQEGGPCKGGGGHVCSQTSPLSLGRKSNSWQASNGHVRDTEELVLDKNEHQTKKKNPSTLGSTEKLLSDTAGLCLLPGSLGLHFFEKGPREGVVLFPAKSRASTETPAAVGGRLLQLRSERITPYGEGRSEAAACPSPPRFVWLVWSGEVSLLPGVKAPGWKDLSCSSDG